MLSLIIPVYNEEAVITDTANAAVSALSKSFDDWELIFVDDGSTDDTLRKLRMFEGEKIRVISYSPNRGKGYAVRRGILVAKGELIFYTDADLAYGLKKVAGAAVILRSSAADIVAGSRKLDRDAYKEYPPVRRLMSGCFALGAKAISGMSYDTQCGFKGFKREAARSLFSRCEEERFAFDFEIMLMAKILGLKVTEIPVRIINHSNSKVNIIRDSLRMACDVVRIKKRLKGAHS